VYRLLFDDAILLRTPSLPNPPPQGGDRRVEGPALAPLGERVARRGVFISRGETGEGVSNLAPGINSNAHRRRPSNPLTPRLAGLRPPKGAAKSEQDVGFSPQAGEGVSSMVKSCAGHHKRAPGPRERVKHIMSGTNRDLLRG